MYVQQTRGRLSSLQLSRHRKALDSVTKSKMSFPLSVRPLAVLPSLTARRRPSTPSSLFFFLGSS